MFSVSEHGAPLTDLYLLSFFLQGDTFTPRITFYVLSVNGAQCNEKHILEYVSLMLSVWFSRTPLGGGGRPHFSEERPIFKVYSTRVLVYDVFLLIFTRAVNWIYRGGYLFPA